MIDFIKMIAVFALFIVASAVESEGTVNPQTGEYYPEVDGNYINKRASRSLFREKGRVGASPDNLQVVMNGLD